jgi:hypothetical protein
MISFTSFLFFALFLSANILTSNARIRVVNNNLNGPGQFTLLQVAIDSSASGDTIYIAPSPSRYNNPSQGRFIVSKRLTFIGAGMRPGEKKDNSALSRIDNRFDVNNTAANGSSWIGLYFQTVSSAINVSSGVSNCQVLRNWFDGSSTHMGFNSASFSGWLIANNHFSVNCGPAINANNNTVTNFIIQNNVFCDISGCGTTIIQSFGNSANCIFSNNLFYGQSNDVSFGDCNNILVENNIFHTISPNGLTNSVINNNITFGTNQNTLPYGSNSGQNNVSNTDPQLTTFSVSNFSPNQNFQPAGGPARTGAVGGGQMGVYGGTFNWNNSAVPPVPVIQRFSITSGATVPAAGSINIQVISTKQN